MQFPFSLSTQQSKPQISSVYFYVKVSSNGNVKPNILRFCLKDTACTFELLIATLIASFYTEFFLFLFVLLLFSFLNRMSLISLSFLSLPSSPSLTPGSSPDSCQTTLPVWLQFGVLFFSFFSLSVLCMCHARMHLHTQTRACKRTLPVPVPQHSTVLNACQSVFGDSEGVLGGTLRGFQGPLESNVLYF